MCEEMYNMTSKPPACTTCSGRHSSSKFNASGWNASAGWVKYLALEITSRDGSGIADAKLTRKCGEKWLCRGSTQVSREELTFTWYLAAPDSLENRQNDGDDACPCTRERVFSLARTVGGWVHPTQLNRITRISQKYTPRFGNHWRFRRGR